MRVTTVDPMTGNDVTDLEDAPFTIEGQGPDALTIYFESEASRQEYILFSAESADAGVIDIYNGISDNETMGTIN
jgi:hypothetical protein